MKKCFAILTSFIMYLPTYIPPYMAHDTTQGPRKTHAWVVAYNGNGIPFWAIAPCILPTKAPPAPTEKDGGGEKGGYSIRVGKWEERYGAVDGVKTWYNTKTRKTTKKDPFR